MTFLERIESTYGRNDVRSPGKFERLEPGQKIQVFVENGSRIIEGTAIGRKKNGLHLIWLSNGGRRYLSRIKSQDVLIPAPVRSSNG